MDDDVTLDEPESAPHTHAGVVIPTPAERGTLSPERREFILGFNRAVSVGRACDEAVRGDTSELSGSEGGNDTPVRPVDGTPRRR